MIPKDKALQLIKIYMYVCSQYQETLNCYCQRYSNNSKPRFTDEGTLIVDSMPIMACCGRNRHGKVAREIADKGYCSTKNQYYHGLKFHLVGYRRKGNLPFPSQFFCPPLQRMTLRCLSVSVSLRLPARPSLQTKYIVTILTGTMREMLKTMNCSLLLRLSRGNRRRETEE